jgi:molecular chaperone GrpE
VYLCANFMYMTETNNYAPNMGNQGAEGAEDTREDMNTDENISGFTHLNEMGANEEELESLREELQQQKDKYLRLFAEFDNFRKRSARENMELRQTAGKEVIISLLDVLDDCDRAERQLQAATNIDQVREGVQLVFSKLRSTVLAKGVKAMQSIHSDFDVEKHEAITEVPVQDTSLRGKVIDEIQKGYYLNDKLIRHAKVVVGK